MDKPLHPNFWYALMIVALAVSLFIFLAGTSIGYSSRDTAHSVGIFLALWAPVFGVLGLRAQLKREGK